MMWEEKWGNQRGKKNNTFTDITINVKPPPFKTLMAIKKSITSIPFRMMPPGLSQLLQDELSFYLFDSIPQQHSPGDDSATWQQKCSGDAPALRATTKIT